MKIHCRPLCSKYLLTTKKKNWKENEIGLPIAPDGVDVATAFV